MALRSEAVSVAGAWARAAKEFGCDLTLISSDAVFTGPWMFHREGSQCNCESPAAKILQLIEAEVAEGCPNALIVRTNAYGWSPLADEAGLVERVLQAAQEGEPLSLDCMRHATPILATDLADLLERAWFCRLEGLYHVAGGERVNPFRFACLLADQFHLPMSSFDAIETSLERRREFGAGETSLQSRKVRKALDVALPLVRDGLSRLYEQYVSGYRDRFGALEPVLAEKVA
jgi:dTDP-4-dehydrorhamnose reductase